MSVYQMREKLFAIGDDYWIEDETGEKVLKVNGKAMRVRETLILEDRDGNELLKIQERKLRLHGTMVLERDDDTVATVRKALISPFRDRFEIDLEAGGELKAHGHVLDHEFEVERDGDDVARVRSVGSASATPTGSRSPTARTMSCCWASPWRSSASPATTPAATTTDAAADPQGGQTPLRVVGGSDPVEGRFAGYCGSPSCFACSAASQKAEMTMSWSPSHLLVWANSRSNAFPVGGITCAVGQGHLPGERPGDVGDDGDPVAASELDRVRGVHADVGKHPDQLLHRRAVCLPSVDRLCAPGDVGDHVRVVDLVQRLPVAGVEEIVALLLHVLGTRASTTTHPNSGPARHACGSHRCRGNGRRPRGGRPGRLRSVRTIATRTRRRALA